MHIFLLSSLFQFQWGKKSDDFSQWIRVFHSVWTVSSVGARAVESATVIVFVFLFHNYNDPQLSQSHTPSWTDGDDRQLKLKLFIQWFWFYTGTHRLTSPDRYDDEENVFFLLNILNEITFLETKKNEIWLFFSYSESVGEISTTMSHESRSIDSENVKKLTISQLWEFTLISINLKLKIPQWNKKNFFFSAVWMCGNFLLVEAAVGQFESKNLFFNWNPIR